MKVIDEQDLREIKERCQKATRGPWQNTDGGEILTKYQKDRQENHEFYLGKMNTWADAELVAHARTDMKNLVAEVERLKKENELLKIRLGRMAKLNGAADE